MLPDGFLRHAGQLILRASQGSLPLPLGVEFFDDDVGVDVLLLLGELREFLDGRLQQFGHGPSISLFSSGASDGLPVGSGCRLTLHQKIQGVAGQRSWRYIDRLPRG